MSSPTQLIFNQDGSVTVNTDASVTTLGNSWSGSLIYMGATLGNSFSGRSILGLLDSGSFSTKGLADATTPDAQSFSGGSILGLLDSQSWSGDGHV